MYIKYVKRKYKTKDGTKESPVFTAIIRFGRDHEFSRSTGETTRRKAEQWAKIEAKHIEENILPRLNQASITVDMLFSNWWAVYARFQASAETMKGRGRDANAALGGETFIQDIDEEKMADFIVDLYEGYRGERAPATVNRIVDVFKKALTIGKKNKDWKPKKDQFPEIDWEDHRQGEPKERLVFLSEIEALDLIRSIEHMNIALAVAWSIATGCRRNETATLKKSDFFKEARYCTVLGKGGQFRHVSLSAAATKIAEASMELNPASEFIFDLTNRRRIWEDAREEFGRPDLRWHDLRHVNGTWLRRFGKLDLKAVGRFLGHNNLASTDRYAHVADEELETAGDALPNLWKAFE